MRAILDSVVEERLHLNPVVSNNVMNMPIYFGNVEQHLNKISLTKVLAAPRSVIADIEDLYEMLMLKDEVSYISLEEDDGFRKIPTNSNIVKLIKACVTGQISTNKEYSNAVGDYVKLLIQAVNTDSSIVMPSIEKKSTLYSVVQQRLNDFAYKILKESGYTITEVVKESKKKTRKKTGLKNLDSFDE